MAGASELVVVANPAAGHGRAGRLIGKVSTTLHRLRVPHEIRVSESGSDLEDLARAAADGGARIVAALGGDGTISLAAVLMVAPRLIAGPHSASRVSRCET